MGAAEGERWVLLLAFLFNFGTTQQHTEDRSAENQEDARTNLGDAQAYRDHLRRTRE